jgi:predicted ATPase
VIQVITKLATRQTLLLVLEDLHWADEMSLRLLAFLGRRVQSERLLVVVTAREEELADAPILRPTLEDLAGARHLVSLNLARLSQADTIALVRMLARARSDAAAVERLGEHVWIASEGNPFMVVETMRALEDGVTPQGSPLPQRVREVISRRLERLGDASQSLLAVASVIGREFEFQLLQRASGLEEDSVAEGVEELVRRRVLTAIGERLDFTHDRIREVAYSALLPWRRKRLHHRIAEAIEELHADSLEPHYEALGTHYREAEVWEKATVYLHQAGNKPCRARPTDERSRTSTTRWRPLRICRSARTPSNERWMSAWTSGTRWSRWEKLPASPNASARRKGSRSPPAINGGWGGSRLT